MPTETAVLLRRSSTSLYLQTAQIDKLCQTKQPGLSYESGCFILILMPKKPTIKFRILYLARQNKDPQDIAKIIGTSIQYVNRVLRDDRMNTQKPPLTIENYAEAYKSGITRKDRLAEIFGVSRMTINRFENRPEFKQKFTPYIELSKRGYDIEQIKERIEEILSLISLFEPESELTKRLKKIVTLL